jgi:hypothetical protein
VWLDYRAGDGPFAPLEADGRDRVGFGEWYLDWLARATRQAHGR